MNKSIESKVLEYKSYIPKKLNDLNAEISSFINTKDETIVFDPDYDGVKIESLSTDK